MHAYLWATRGLACVVWAWWSSGGLNWIHFSCFLGYMLLLHCEIIYICQKICLAHLESMFPTFPWDDAYYLFSSSEHVRVDQVYPATSLAIILNSAPGGFQLITLFTWVGQPLSWCSIFDLRCSNIRNVSTTWCGLPPSIDKILVDEITCNVLPYLIH